MADDGIEKGKNMFYSNTLNLIQVGGGTQVKQGDLGSRFSYKLANEKDQELDDFDKEVAHINLVLDDKIVFTTTATVDNSIVTFNIDKAIPVGLYFLEIKIRDYIFPSDKQTIIFVQSGAVAYDLKELVPNYDTNMTLKGILSDLSQKGIDISDLNRQLAEKANKDEVTNVMTPKGNIAYASLPTTGNEVGWYYYCPDGDGTHGAGNYVWNGTSWYFGGTGDEGYNLLKEDLEYYRTNNVDMRLNINFVDGAINGSGDYIDSDISSRMNYRSFDAPVIIVSLATISIYKKQGTNITALWQNISASYPLIKIINDIDAEYGLFVGTKNAKENVFIYTIDSMEYDQNYNTSVNIPLDFMGYASYTKGDDGTLEINNPNENIFNKFNPIKIKRDGYLEFSNPSNVVCIVTKTDENLNVLDRMSKSDSEFRFDVDKGYLYWFNIYDKYAKFKNNPSNIDVLLNYTPKTFEYHDDSKLRNIVLTYEIGTIDGAGGLASSDKVIRTNPISVKKNKLVICTFPTSITSKVCATIDDSTNKPIDNMMYSSFSFFAEKDEDVRFTFYKQDLSTITDVSEMPIDDIKVMIFDADANDINVYAPNSRHKGNILIDGVNGQRILQALFNSLDSIKINIMGGDYYVSEIYTTGKSKSKAYLYTNENWTEYVRVIEFIGEQPARTGYNNAVRFHIPDTENADAFMLATRKGTALDSTLLSQCVCHVENICCIGEDYTQDFVYFDFTHAQASMIEHCEVRGDGSLKGLQVLDKMPNENCVGIRVGYGSNNGIQNYVKHCLCYAVGIGFSNCGEHYIMEDNLAHHCKIGFSFGDRLTRGNFEHPNIMIGCSIEGCYRLMLLSKYGTIEESEVDNARNTLICIGLSTETKWEYPKDDSRYDDGNYYRTLPIKEMIKGNYRGRIEADYDGNSLFEADGSGKNMTQTRY